MWTTERRDLADGVQKCFVREDGAVLSHGRFIELWRDPDDAFRRFFVEILQAAPFRCYRFETPPATRRGVDRPFEFVLVDSPEIDLPPDPADFRAHFDARGDDVLVFDNLGGDATLVAPRPVPGVAGYAHIAAFVRYAPSSQQLALWKTVGDALESRLGERPVWLNTAGGGVAWLHVRLDSRPKYYVYRPYTSAVGDRDNHGQKEAQ